MLNNFNSIVIIKVAKIQDLELNLIQIKFKKLFIMVKIKVFLDREEE